MEELGAGATACTVVNINSGGSTRISGVISATALTLVFLFGWDIISQIPFAVVSSLLFVIGLSLVDWKNFKSFKQTPKADVYVMLLVFLLTTFWNLLYAVMLGVFLASLQFLKKMADEVELGNSKSIVDRQALEIIDSFENTEKFTKKVNIRTIHGPLFFGFSHRFYTSTNNLGSEVEHVVFNFSVVSHIDQSGMMTFNRIIDLINEKNISYYITDISEDHQILFKKDFKYYFSEKIFKNIEDCLLSINQNHFS